MAKVIEWTENLHSELQDLGTPERASGEKRYLKSELEFLGVNLPMLRKALKAHLKQLPSLDRELALDLAEKLWQPPIHELRRAAVEILCIAANELRPADLPLIEGLLRESRTWALVDELAARVAGSIFQRHPDAEDVLKQWAADEDFWIRRSALLVHLLPLRAGEGDFVRFCRLADSMLHEKEFFIRKAIGWVLRETAKKRPGMVAEWLIPRAARASGLTVREAVKHMPEELRQQVLEARANP